jgi:acyl-CoA reductase-like NAD-dependent aldehyde dehydrogenase
MSIATQQLFIDGAHIDSSDGQFYEHQNAETGEAVSRAAAASVADADAAVAAAARAFPSWAALDGGARGAILGKAADLLEERAPEIAQIMTLELGATFGWGMFNCAFAAKLLRQSATLPDQVRDDVVESGIPGLEAVAARRPLGVVAAIAPWNAPIILSARSVAAPLALGNTVVFKASELCPRTHGAVIQTLIDAGVPHGALGLITNAPGEGPEIVNRLIDNPVVRHVNFTGSTEVGRAIAVRAAGKLKRTLLELGGKAPLLVLHDADLDEAAAAASFGAFMNSGQICMSTERILVDESVSDAFVAILAQKARALSVGDPQDHSTVVGPVVTRESAARIRELIADATARGATLVAGGKVEGAYVEPTILTGVTSSMRIYHEESFGPVVAISTFADNEEAVQLANDTLYGLSAAVFGGDVSRARGIAERINSGICHVNGATVHDEPQMPFGGVKESGWGRFGGPYAVAEFTELRWLTVQNGNRHYPI